jgi:cob(I)alamin adenosyltransferase
MTAETPAERHRLRMQRKKAVVDAKIATATAERGVLVVNTGNGKGKSSSAFGMVARALGHGMRVAVVQFIKGSFSTGEEVFFRRFEEIHPCISPCGRTACVQFRSLRNCPEVDYHVMGEGFTWETQDRERDIHAATAAWEQARRFLADPAFHMVVLDELNIALKHRYIPLDEVLEALRARPASQHVVVTGRAAPPELIELADTVTEMNVVKHAFTAGIRAQKGIEL